MKAKTTKTMHTVTGAFGYSGSHIAQALLQKNLQVNTLTNSINRSSSLQGKIEALPLSFDDPQKLGESLQNTKVLYNNYWVRFNHDGFTHEEAVQNTFALIDAAKKAGVERFVHISITNPSQESELEYFSGKARIEEYLVQSGLSYCILRPAVLFGGNDILINNIAWMVRRFPLFAMFGKGDYRLQPVHVKDLAEMAVKKGAERKNETLNALGPDTFTYKEMIQKIAAAFGKKPWVFASPQQIVYYAGALLGFFMKDVPITRYEIKGLMDELLYTNPNEPRIIGKISLGDFIKQNAMTLGIHYASELARRYDRQGSYE